MSFISKNIKYLIEANRVAKDTLGAELGLKRGAVGSYMAGKSSPKIDTLIKISEKFKVSVDDLLKKDLTKQDAFENVSFDFDNSSVEKLEKQLAECKKKGLELEKRYQQLLQESAKAEGRLEGKLEYVTDQLKEREQLAEQRKAEADIAINENGQLKGRIQELENERIEILTHLKRYENTEGFEANGTFD